MYYTGGSQPGYNYPIIFQEVKRDFLKGKDKTNFYFYCMYYVLLLL